MSLPRWLLLVQGHDLGPWHFADLQLPLTLQTSVIHPFEEIACCPVVPCPDREICHHDRRTLLRVDDAGLVAFQRDEEKPIARHLRPYGNLEQVADVQSRLRGSHRLRLSDRHG